MTRPPLSQVPDNVKAVLLATHEDDVDPDDLECMTRDELGFLAIRGTAQDCINAWQAKGGVVELELTRFR